MESDVKWNWPESQIWPNDIFCGGLTRIDYLIAVGGFYRDWSQTAGPIKTSQSVFQWLRKHNWILPSPLHWTNNWRGIFTEQVIPQTKYLLDQLLVIKRKRDKGAEKMKTRTRMRTRLQVIRRHYERWGAAVSLFFTTKPCQLSNLSHTSTPPLPLPLQLPYHTVSYQTKS